LGKVPGRGSAAEITLFKSLGIAIEDLAKTGDSMRKQIICEYTLESRNEKASGGVFDLTTS
jgi:hypothetical protein